MLEEKKDIAIASMLKLEGEEATIRIDFQDLAHGAPRLLNAPAYKGYKPIWNPWEILTKRSRLIQLKECAKEEIKKRGWEFDIICGMSNTGTALATLLTVDLDKKLIMSDNKSFLFLPSRPKPGERVLLLDSLIVSGYHLLNNVEKITKQSGGSVPGLVVIAIDDFEKDVFSIVKDWLNNQKIIYFFKCSELYEWWKEEIEKIQTLSVIDWIDKRG